MTANNDITGDLIKTKSGSDTLYQEGWDRIFGKKEKAQEVNFREIVFTFPEKTDKI